MKSMLICLILKVSYTSWRDNMKNKIKCIRYFTSLLFKTNPLYIFLVVLESVISSFSNIVVLYFTKILLDKFAEEVSIKELFMTIIIYVIIILILKILWNTLSTTRELITVKANSIINNMFNKKLYDIDYYLFEDSEFNKKMFYAKKCFSEYTGGVYSYSNFLISFLSTSLTIILSILILVKYKNPLLTIFIVISAILSLLISNSNIKSQEKLYENYRAYDVPKWYYNLKIMEFESQKSLRCYDTNDLLLHKSNIYNEMSYKDIGEKVRKDVRNSFLNKIIFYSLSFITISLLVVSYKNSVITIASLTLLYHNVTKLKSSFTSLFTNVIKFHNESNYLINYIDFMETKSEYSDGNEKIDSIDSIEFDKVYFKYPNLNDYTLEDISFKIDNKEKISLIGVNGAGKTTLIKLLCRFYKPTQGKILINGIDISQIESKSLYRNLSIMFQDFKIVSFTIKDNVAGIDENKSKLDDSFKKIDFYNRVEELPYKENTYINKFFDDEGVVFSGGELQKMAFARSIYKDSSFVVLDEPTSSLDVNSETNIYYNFNNIIGKKLCIYVSHRMSSCKFSDNIIVLNNKKITQIGNHNELIKDKEGIYYKLFASQSNYYLKDDDK